MASEELVGLRIALYARFSKEGQSESSIEDQLRRCKDFAIQRGGTLRDEWIFSDSAESGEGSDRASYERMMRLATSRPRELDVIIIEDLSRLSRAPADLFTIQRMFEFLEVRLIGVADGIDTFASHSTLTFGMKTLVSSIYLSDLRDKTLRGLEGRALAGLATGGVAFGYCLRKELTADGRAAGTKIEISEDKAKVVRRIFALYLEGYSLDKIAKTLNDDGVEPPRVHVKGRRVGWKDSTIRAMLHNESYFGRWRYKVSQWRKVPGTNRRVPVRKNDARAIVAQRPELRIVDEQTWHATQERLAQVRRFYTRRADGAAKGRAVPGRQSPYLFSSLLCCGVCGGKMIIAGGSADVYYRCEANKKRGTCANALSVRESVVRLGLVDELRRRLVCDQGLAYARKRVAERLGDLLRERDVEAREHRQRLDKLTNQIDKLVDFIADGHGSAAVAEKLRGLERAADVERSRLAAYEKQAAAVVRLPSPDDLMGIVFDLEKRLLSDTARGREELRRIFRDGRITLIPQPGGFYVARSEILPLVLLTQSPSPEPSSEDSSGGRCPASSCAGRI
ncbi:MAG: recombinase family protein [Myxococcota bacterium]